MDKITVGVALDQPSLASFRHALDIAAGSGATLRAVLVDNSMNASALSFAGGSVVSELAERTREIWKRGASPVEERIRKLASDRDVDLEVAFREGRVADRLLEASEVCPLTVVGRGRGAAEEGELSVTAELLLRRCKQGLMIVPTSYQRPARVVAAYAGKALGDRVLDLAGKVSDALGVGVILLRVGSTRQEVADIHARAREWLSSSAIEAEFVALVGEPETAIPDFLSPSDLLVVGPHGRRPLLRLLLGDVSEELVRMAPCPVVMPSRMP